MLRVGDGVDDAYVHSSGDGLGGIDDGGGVDGESVEDDVDAPGDDDVNEVHDIGDGQVYNFDAGDDE